MSKAEQFIKDCTRSCSNVVYYHNRNFTHGTDYVEGSGIEVQYSPWLTPEQALRAVEIAREEMIDTPEAKGVDLEDDVDKILEANDWNFDKIDFYQFAKYFFELGLKVQKGK